MHVVTERQSHLQTAVLRKAHLQTAVLRKVNQIRWRTKGDGSTVQWLKNPVSSNREKHCLIPGKGCSLTDPKRWHEVAGILVQV